MEVFGHAGDPPQGAPADWIVHGGKPARILAFNGWPSYEDESGEGLLIYDLLLVKAEYGDMKALPRSYAQVSLVAPEGPVPLHHSPDAHWCYRPIIYNKETFRGWTRFGSQVELVWRYGLSLSTEAQIMAELGEFEEFNLIWDEIQDMEVARGRARALLFEHLSDQQKIEYWSSGGDFRCRGATTGNVYVIRHGNGFASLEPYTNDEAVTYCLHPEEWIPHDDVSLATKLALEDPDLEIECLENARQTILPRPRYRWGDGDVTRAAKWAAGAERELIT